MGNKPTRITVNFSDSAWRNTLDVITTNIDNNIGGDGDLVVNSADNATDNTGRRTRSIDVDRHTAQWTFDDWQEFIDDLNEIKDETNKLSVWNIPICELILAILAVVNVLLVCVVLISFCKCYNL